MPAGCYTKQVCFKANIGFDIDIFRKYRYRVSIGYEKGKEWIPKSVSFRNNELTDIGFDFDFEILDVRMFYPYRDNFGRAYVVKYRFQKCCQN